MADERNFRSVYYGKVGFKGIEEKKSLEIILKEEPIDKLKLSQFCLKFPVPAAYRHFIWQLLLAVVPCHQTCHSLALDQRKRQFADLKHALEIMRKIDQSTSREVLFLKMYLIEEKSLPFDDIGLIENNQRFLDVAKIFCDLMADDVNAFWLAVKFMNLIEKQTKSIDLFINEFESIVNREDVELFQHACKVNLFETVSFRYYISSAFAALFQEEILEKIWDKLVGGGPAYLCYVCASILLVLKRQILALKEPVDMVKFERFITSDHVEWILSLATDLWCKEGCPLEPQPDDLPVIIEKNGVGDDGILVTRG